MDTESRREAAATGDSNGAGPGDPNGGEVGIEPILEADFQPSSYGYRRKKSATQALEAIREAGKRGHHFVVDADIQGYLDGMDRNARIKLVRVRSDGGWQGEGNAGGNPADQRRR